MFEFNGNVIRMFMFRIFFCQVTQLDMTMKEHKSELQQKVITLEHALNQARYELSERAVEVRHSRAFLSVFVVLFSVCAVLQTVSQTMTKRFSHWKEKESFQQQQRRLSTLQRNSTVFDSVIHAVDSGFARYWARWIKQGPIPERLTSPNPGLKFCSNFYIYLPSHGLE